MTLSTSSCVSKGMRVCVCVCLRSQEDMTELWSDSYKAKMEGCGGASPAADEKPQEKDAKFGECDYSWNYGLKCCRGF